MKRLFQSQYPGQSLIFFVFVSLILFGMLAFALDMGNVYYMRRWAQNSADAAALAAARQYCDYKDTNMAKATAKRYVEGYGGEQYNLPTGVLTQTLTSISFADLDGTQPTPVTPDVFGEVEVGVEITHTTFVAGLFGIDSFTEPAVASAGCMGGLSTTIIPIAWYCLEPENEDYCVDFSEDQICEIGVDPYYVFFGDESVSSYLWCEHWDVITDTNSIPIDCIYDVYTDPDDPTNVITYTVEPISTITTEHKWEGVDLDGDNCPQKELKDIIKGIHIWPEGWSFPLPGTWLDQCEGGLPPSFDIIKTKFLGSNLSIPAFDKYCKGSHPDPEELGFCNPTGLWNDATDDWLDPLQGPSTRWFRLHSTPSLQVTCVKGSAPQPCTARDFLLNNPDYPIPEAFKNSVMSLEGCFVQDTSPSVVPCPGCPDVGTWTVTLTR